MKTQTERRPDSQRPARSANKGRKYTKQTAHFEARRDGKPIIFGWGGHLTRHQKNQLARRAVWATTGLIVALIIAIIVGFWVNINIVVPNKAITSVNGQNIPQSDYHKMAVYRGAYYNNLLNGVNGLTAQRDALQSKINSTKDATLKATLTAQLSDITNNQIPTDQSLYVQSPLGNEAVEWLQDDIVIRNWLNQQSATLQNRINPTDAAVTKALNSFKSNFPRGVNYNDFLSQNTVSDSDMRAMLTVSLRRDDMQSYLASLITSPTRQVRASAIELATPADAKSIIQQLKSGADIAKLARQNRSIPQPRQKVVTLAGWLPVNTPNNMLAICGQPSITGSPIPLAKWAISAPI